MNRLRRLEALFTRIEGVALVGVVLVMLGLASYNVLYRNVLVPLQVFLAHSGPPPAGPEPGPALAERVELAELGAAPDAPGADHVAAGVGDFAGAFGGAFGSTGGVNDDAPSFRGGFGEEPAGESFAGAFGGGANPSEGDAPDERRDPPEDEFGDDAVFENLAEIAPVDVAEPGEPKGGPPPAGSLAAGLIELISAVKLDWIDVLLRQLVIAVSFLGGALATVRRKHINIDAGSKLLPPRFKRWAHIATDALALAVCATLARAGQSLVQVSRTYPRELTPFADDWTFQLMFPVGFGLLGFHFAVRLAGSIAELMAKVDPDASGLADDGFDGALPTTPNAARETADESGAPPPEPAVAPDPEATARSDRGEAGR